MPFVLISSKDGDKYHRIGKSGHAACGNLSPKAYTRRDMDCVIERAHDIQTVSATEAKQRGFELCDDCEVTDE
jgi:hypothetical protein